MRDPEEVAAAIPFPAERPPEPKGRRGRSLRLLETRLTRAS
jgi:hypothetical protein